MKLQRGKYLKMLAVLYFRSAVKIQKYLRGFKVSKRMTPERHAVTFKVMQLAMEEILAKHKLDLYLMLCVAWKKYKFRDSFQRIIRVQIQVKRIKTMLEKVKKQKKKKKKKVVEHQETTLVP